MRNLFTALTGEGGRIQVDDLEDGTLGIVIYEDHVSYEHGHAVRMTPEVACRLGACLAHRAATLIGDQAEAPDGQALEVLSGMAN